jgi:hypothetical protein
MNCESSFLPTEYLTCFYEAAVWTIPCIEKVLRTTNSFLAGFIVEEAHGLLISLLQ